MRIVVKKWRGVASWHWKMSAGGADEEEEEDGDHVCGICRNRFDATCPDCAYPGDSCPPAWGQCSHPFHLHCLMAWLATESARDQCPLCRAPWQFKHEEPPRGAAAAPAADAEAAQQGGS